MPSAATADKATLSQQPTKLPQKPKLGEAFTPWRKLWGIYWPDVVGQRKDLKDGPKRLYERLVRRAGENATCWPEFDTLAAYLGKSEKTVRKDAKVLADHGLIRWKTRDGRRSNTYEFLWDASFDAEFERKHITAQLNGNPKPSTASERKDPADLSAPRVPGNLGKESSTRNSIHTPDCSGIESRPQKAGQPEQGCIPTPKDTKPEEHRPDPFEEFCGIFIAAVVALAERDVLRARAKWAQLDRREHSAILADLLQRIRLGYWSGPEHMPTPLNCLCGQYWRRRAGPRLLKKPTRREQQLAEGVERFLRNEREKATGAGAL